MRSDTSSRRGRLIASAAAAVLLAGGIITIGLSLHAERPAPAPTGQAAASTPATPTPAGSPTQPAVPGEALTATVPVRVEVPSIGVNAALLPLGRQADGEIETPPGEPGAPAGWYKNSPTPGQNGSAIILGHVNTTNSDIGLFYRLHELTPGKTITVSRTDHTAAVFTVDKVDVYHKANFPTVEVYKNADRPELRLITCGGYNPATREYLDNTVVYAHLTSTQPA